LGELVERPDGGQVAAWNRAGRCDGERPGAIAAADLDPATPLTYDRAHKISIDGDTDLAQHWLDSTAHVSN
jgi:hypothetical protein